MSHFFKFFLLLILLFLILLPSSFLYAHASTERIAIIHITEDGFTPPAVEIAIGDAVIFENVGTKDRWPASNLHPTHTLYPNSDIRKCETDEAKKIFDACKPIKLGEAYSFSFTESGTWRYHDHLNSSFGGEIIVDDNPFIKEGAAQKLHIYGQPRSILTGIIL